ncbi:MAG: lysine-sensitive aspartokinase 3 [Deltaproteobacteria bacterium]|jgi:aspartate kinase|nr:lysine-sensitive aspartokinase 3 [Deltaproteobacteria bacterium]
MKVLKFGGTSIKNADLIRKVAQIISANDENCIVVFSACATITDLLSEIGSSFKKHNETEALKLFEQIFAFHLDLIEKLEIEQKHKNQIIAKLNRLKTLIPALAVLGDSTPRSLDIILGFGEDLSRMLISFYLLEQNLPLITVDPRSFMKTDSNHAAANLLMEESSSSFKGIFATEANSVKYYITSGFIGKSKNDDTTTLGRGGSDYTASILASVLNARCLEIWTDVSGIMSCDPRLVDNVHPIKKLTYSEAAELAFFGARILHPKTIRPAVKKEIPVYIKNTFNPDSAGTVVCPVKNPQQRVKAVAFQKNITVINIYSDNMLGAFGFLEQIFSVFTKHCVPVDLITTSEVNVSVTVDGNQNTDDLLEDLSRFSEVTVETHKAMISVIGEGLKNTSGISARFFGVLKGINVLMVSVGASEVNLSIIVDDKDMVEAVKLLHEEFFPKL